MQRKIRTSKRCFSLLLCSILVFGCLVCHIGISVSASFGQNVVTWYEEENETYLIPDVTGGSKQLFYKSSDGHYDSTFLAHAIPGILLQIGIATNAAKLANFLDFFESALSSSKTIYEYRKCFDSNGICVGYTADNILGCVREGSDVVVCSDDAVDGIYEAWNEFYTEVPDYFQYEIVSGTETLNNYYSSSTRYLDACNHMLAVQRDFLSDSFTQTIQINGNTLYGGSGVIIPFSDYFVYNSTNTKSFSSFCSLYGLKQSGDSVSFLDIYSGPSVSTSIVDYRQSDGSLSQARYESQISYQSSSPYYSISYGSSVGSFKLGKDSARPLIVFSASPQYITIYRSVAVLNQFLKNEYHPSVYTTDSYNDYSTVDDHSVTYTKTQANRISDSYNNVYNNANESYYNYVNQTTQTYEGDTTNQTYDNSSSVVYNSETNTTTVTYNYYGIDQEGLNELVAQLIAAQTVNTGESGGDGSGSGDSGSGESGGESGSGSSIWDRVADAIANLLSVIGKVIGGIIAGIIELITQILSVFTDIPELFSGFTAFLQTLFSWMPEELIQVIVAAFGVFVLVALIKFIRG